MSRKAIKDENISQMTELQLANKFFLLSKRNSNKIGFGSSSKQRAEFTNCSNSSVGPGYYSFNSTAKSSAHFFGKANLKAPPLCRFLVAESQPPRKDLEKIRTGARRMFAKDGKAKLPGNNKRIAAGQISLPQGPEISDLKPSGNFFSVSSRTEVKADWSTKILSLPPPPPPFLTKNPQNFVQVPENFDEARLPTNYLSPKQSLRKVAERFAESKVFTSYDWNTISFKFKLERKSLNSGICNQNSKHLSIDLRSAKFRSRQKNSISKNAKPTFANDSSFKSESPRRGSPALRSQLAQKKHLATSSCSSNHLRMTTKDSNLQVGGASPTWRESLGNSSRDQKDF